MDVQAPAGRAGSPSISERLETSRQGRLLISVFVVITVVCIALTNMHDSKLKSEFVKVGQPFLNALGLDQAWNVFARIRAAT